MFNLNLDNHISDDINDKLRHGQCLCEVGNEESGQYAVVKGVCVVSGESYSTSSHDSEELTNAIISWSGGNLAQRAFPFFSTEEREFIISGICPNAWNNMFNKKGGA